MPLDIGPFGKDDKEDKDKKDTKDSKRKRRKKAIEGAMKGYKRKGGILERMREGFKKLKGLGKATEPKKHNPY